jgi:hypothetical protein
MFRVFKTLVMTSSSSFRLPALFLFVALASISGLHATTTFSLAGNFDTTSDSAANEWAYGTFTSVDDTLANPQGFNVPSSLAHSGSTSSEFFWTFPPSGGETSDPNIEKNFSGSTVSTAGAKFLSQTVSFGPYQGPAVAQFTVPYAGVYDISVTFQTDQIRGTETSDGTTGYLYVGGVAAKNTGILQDPGHVQFGTAVTLTDDVSLVKGETVDFALSGGAFTTEVDATLTVPEPSTYAMMTLALLLLAVPFRRQLLASASRV